jgi:hypothetical protein
MTPKIGDICISKYNEVFTIVGYNKYSNVDIIYEDAPDFVIKTTITNIHKGDTYNPFRKVTCGRGYHGVGAPISIKGVKTEEYVKWHGMLSRCYGIPQSERGIKSVHCYRINNIEVHPDWFNYQNFYKWWNDNILSLNGCSSILCLDKDLLGSSSDIYSDRTCCVLPYELNIAIQLSCKVYFDKRRNTYQVRTARTITNEPNYIGKVSTEEEGLHLYAKAKDKYIKDSYIKMGLKLPQEVEFNLLNFNAAERIKQIKSKVQ